MKRKSRSKIPHIPATSAGRTDSLDDCDIRGRCRSDLVNAIVRSFFENHLSRLAQYRREKKSLFNNYKPESHA